MHALASTDEIAAFLDRLLEVEKFASEPDSNGLLYRGGAGVSRVAAAVNTSMQTIVAAVKAGCQLMVVHHPPWRNVDKHLYEEKMAALEAGQLSLYAAHASLDCAEGIGNGWVLAGLLGMRVERTFAEFEGGQCGVIGAFDGSYGDFIQSASGVLGVQVEAHEHAKSFGTVAIVTGAGGDTEHMAEARSLGADTYLTGEGSMFTRMFARETDMNLVFGTHHATEAPGIKALGQRISDEAQVPWEFIADSPDVF